MTGPTHLVIGLASAVAVSRITSTPLNAIMLLCVLLGSVGPDIDSDSGSISKPGRIFSRFLPRGAARMLDELGQVVSNLAQFISGHRGMFHWPILAVAMISIGGAFEHWWLFWFGIGYLSHILADACTKHGVPLLGPCSSKNYGLALLRTGSPLEFLIAAGALFITLHFGWELLPERTRDGFETLWQALQGRV